jgi:hypothetical protein
MARVASMPGCLAPADCVCGWGGPRLVTSSTALCSAIIALPPSHHLLFQPIFVVQTTKDETDRDPQMQWKPVPVVLQQSWQG